MSPTEAPPVIVAEDSSVSAVWPWQAEPYKLWSLLEMLRLYGATLLTVVVELDREKALLLWPRPNHPVGDDYAFTPYEPIRQKLKQLIEESERHDRRFFLPDVVSQAKRLLKRLEDADDDPTTDANLVVALVNELEANL